MNAWRETSLIAVVTLIWAHGATALIKDDVDGAPDVPLCEPQATVQVTLRQSGIPLTGNAVTISAATAKLTVREPLPEAPASCRSTLHALSRVGGFAWSIAQRPGSSTATLENTSGLNVTLTPDRVGAYRVRFTACPDGCEAPLSGGGALPVAPLSRDVIVAAVDEFAYPPDTEPIRPQQEPTSPQSFPGMDAACHTADEAGSVQADTLGPAWVTVRRWRGPQDYETVEGVVTESSVATRDAILNHHSQDAIFFIRPDPRDRRLMKDDQGGRLEVEWESNSFDEFAWPSRGDRASVTGFWIHDCGHGGKTEIHPPVMVATHRPRAVAIPPDAGYGTNVFVPGIVTEVQIGRDGGEATGNCSLPGLHQPGGAAGFDFGPHSCLPQTEGFVDGNPIQREFSFTIYLPRNPQAILAEAGREVPPVPLYTEVSNPRNAGGPQPQIQLTDGGNALEVTIDLSGFTGAAYSRRIVAAWAYAAPDNWLLRRWNVTVPLLDVHDDGDSIVRGDGDWKFWININSTTREWVRLFDCDGCVHGRETFGGTPLETGANRLGPDLLLYPQQRILVHTTGYETDWIWADNTGRVVDLRPQRDEDYASRSQCRRSGPAGCAHYTLHYSVRDRGSVGEARLSAAAQSLYDAYALTSENPVGPITGQPVREFNHPADLAIDGVAMRLDDTAFFLEQEIEPGTLHDIDNERYRTAVTRLRELRPELAELYFRELAEEVRQARTEVPPDEFAAGLAALEATLPGPVWEAYFDDSPDAETDYRLVLLVLLIIAAAGWLNRKQPDPAATG